MADYSSYTFTIGQIPSGAGGYLTMLNGLVTELETDVSAVEADIVTINTNKISQGGTLTANLNAGGFKLTNLGASSDANDACTVSYANSLLTLGGAPGSVAITDLSKGTGTADQFVVINSSGTAVTTVTSRTKAVKILSAESSGLSPVSLPSVLQMTHFVNMSEKSVANDVFFLGDDSSTASIYSSTDAENWTSRAMPSAQDWGKVCWTGTNYVCVNVSGTAAAYSADTISWTAATLNTIVTSCNGCASDGAGKVLANNSGSSTYQISTDHGVTWSDGAGTVAYGAIVFVGSLFVALANSAGTSYYTSSDGTSWTTQSYPDGKTNSNSYYCSNNGKLFVTMSDGSIYYTTNGTGWTKLTDGLSEYSSTPQTCVATEIGGVFYAFLNNTGNLFSHDGVTWYLIDDQISMTDGSLSPQYSNIAVNSTGTLGITRAGQSTPYTAKINVNQIGFFEV